VLIKRRDAVTALLTGLVAPFLPKVAWAARKRATAPDFAAIERSVSGRLGVAVLDEASGERLAHRSAERFPMCSTFKWLLGAQVLSRVDSGQEQLDRILPYGERELLAYAPVTRAHVHEGGMSVADLMAAAIQQSDNTAANLLLKTVGSPASLTAYLRRLGDGTTRLDRAEPELNSAAPGDPRDTTTPAAMLETMRVLLVGDRLSGSSRERLLALLEGSMTGSKRLRAGFPASWRVGDKTGTGEHGSTNDIAIAWPAGRKELLLTAYLTETSASDSAREGALAQVAREVTQWIESL
jgi:beta-lactamase class A